MNDSRLARLWGIRSNRKDSDFKDHKTAMGLDKFGFPAVPLANTTLVQQDDYGDNLRDLEANWQDWLHHYPFDIKVTKKLIELFRNRLTKLDPEADAAFRQKLQNKLRILDGRLARYQDLSVSHRDAQ